MKAKIDRGLLVDFCDKYNTSLKFISQGSSRLVYLSPSGKTVFKIPSTDEGFEKNKFENFVCNHFTYIEKENYAQCRLLLPPFNDILAMEYVDTSIKLADLSDEVLDWASEIKGMQVGKNLKGRYVAYDYGDGW